MPQSTSLSYRVASFLITWRYGLAVLAGLLLLLAWPLANRLEFDRRIEQMFPASDPAVAAFELMREEFGGNAVAMMVYHDRQLMSREGLARVSKLAEETAEIPGVLGVLSLAQVNDALSRAMPGRFLGFSDVPAILEDGPLPSGFRDLFAGYTHDTEDQLAAVVAILEPSRPELHAEAIAAMRTVASRLPAAQQPVALVGEPVLVSEGFSLVDADGRRLATTTIWLLGITTLFMFRSPRWVLAELAVIVWSVQLTRAASSVLGLQLTMVSSMLTAIVTVIAVASVIHIGVGFATRRIRGDSQREATLRTLAMVLPPIFWACATDAAGFFALTISEVGPVRDFGLMMTLGTGMVLVALVLLLPFWMMIPVRRFHTRLAPGDRWIRRHLVRMVIALSGHRRAVGITVLILSLLTGLGLNRLRTETNFIRNFRASSELAQAYAMVETEFGGAGVWDIVLPAPQRLTTEYLSSVRFLEAKLRQIRVTANGRTPQPNELPPNELPPNELPPNEPQAGAGNAASIGLTKVLSMADADATAASSPLLAIASPEVRIAGMRAAMPAFSDALLTPRQADQPRFLRIMLRSPERLSSAAKLALISAVNRQVEQHTSTMAWRAMFAEDREVAGQVTGYYVLLARLIESLLADQWICLALAAMAVFVMIAIAFRSLRLAAVCMVPNLLPVLAVLGMMGLLGIRVNMGAAMIAAVSIGLTIDGSIHFAVGCREARRRGSSPARAVLHAQRRVGMPVLLATLALGLGFSVLATSAFIPTVTFGVLVTAALLSGSVANLTLLPLLLIELPPSAKR
ncbi:efflux RND transporter permease subunit [Planctomycetaceae bacterium SH139]